MTSLLDSSFLCLFKNRYYNCNTNQKQPNLGGHKMSWININEHGVPVNDDRYQNRFSLSLDYTPFYGHGVCTKTEDVIAR